MIQQDKKILNPWSKLEVPSMGNVSMLRVDASNKYGIFYAKSPSNQYMLFFFVEEFPNYTKRVELNGVEVALMETADKKAIVLTLKNSQDWELFLHVCMDLNNVTKDSKTERDAAGRFYNRLLYWQYFMKHNRTNLLTKEEQLGLMGELLFLEMFVLPKYEPLEAMAFWTGPDGDVQDFSIDNKRIEVKTCASPSKNEIKISSAQQLYSANCSVFLSVVYLMPSSVEHEGAISLYRLAKRVAEKLLRNPVAYEIFIQKLASVGMFIEDVYDNEFMVCNNIKFFDVSAEFPKITPNMLSDAINKVVYTISLNLASQYEVSQDTVI